MPSRRGKSSSPKLEFAPWIDDPDPPDRVTDADIKRMVEGFAKLAPDLVKPELRKRDESKHPREFADKQAAKARATTRTTSAVKSNRRRRARTSRRTP